MGKTKRALALVATVLLTLSLMPCIYYAYAAVAFPDSQANIFSHISYNIYEDPESPYTFDEGEEQFPDEENGFAAFEDGLYERYFDPQVEEIQEKLDKLIEGVTFGGMYQAFDISDSSITDKVPDLIKNPGELIKGREDAVLTWANTELLQLKKDIAAVFDEYPQITGKEKIETKNDLKDPETGLEYSVEARYTQTYLQDLPELKPLNNQDPFTIDELTKLIPRLFEKHDLTIVTNFSYTLQAHVGVSYEYRVEGAQNQEGLPQKAKDLTPQDTKKYPVNEEVRAQDPEEESFVDESGVTWNFIGYDFPTLIAKEDESQNLFIGRWRAEKKAVKISHVFVPSDDSPLKELPIEVISLTPESKTFKEDGDATPTPPSKTEVKVDNGTWSFVSYSEESWPLSKGDHVFVGFWKFTPAESTITYTFERDPKSDPSVDLPNEVKQLTPGQETHSYTETVEPKTPVKTQVKVDGGSWTFTNYTEKNWVVNEPSHTFIGYWTYEKDPVSPTPEVPEPTDPTPPTTPDPSEPELPRPDQPNPPVEPQPDKPVDPDPSKPETPDPAQPENPQPDTPEAPEPEKPEAPAEPVVPEKPKDPNPDKEKSDLPKPEKPETSHTSTSNNPATHGTPTQSEKSSVHKDPAEVRQALLPKTGETSPHVAYALIASAGIAFAIGTLLLKKGANRH